mmetsp:Transcript_11922/g.25213  ORF Transcript_11922/g.25213 Transcript_11922/m.25213 type:complete len:227 (-) Transcript_11922:572-1252(-)
MSNQIDNEYVDQPFILEGPGNAVPILPAIIGRRGKQLQESGRKIIGNGKLFCKLFGRTIEKVLVSILMKLHQLIEQDGRLDLVRCLPILHIDRIEQLFYGSEPKSTSSQVIPPISLLFGTCRDYIRYVAPYGFTGNSSGAVHVVRFLSILIELWKELETSLFKSNLRWVDLGLAGGCVLHGPAIGLSHILPLHSLQHGITCANDGININDIGSLTPKSSLLLCATK